MYIGSNSISKLKTFLDGFTTYKWLNKIKANSFLPFELFLPYMEQHYNHNGLAYNWDGIFLLNCKNDEAESLEKFFELFDDFQKIKPLTASMATIGSTEMNFFQNQNEVLITRFDENKNEVDYGPAEKIYLIEYSSEFGCMFYRIFNNEKIDSEFCVSVKAAKRKAEVEYGSSVDWKAIELKDTFSVLNFETSAAEEV